MGWESEQAPVANQLQHSWGAPSSQPQPSPQSRDDLILTWRELDKQLDIAKAAEINVRNALLKLCWGVGNNTLEGTENLDLGKGYILKAVFKQNYKLDKSDDKVEAALQRLEKCGDKGKFVAERVIKWKPELSLPEWRELSTEHREIIGAIVTITPGQASLELVEPKQK